MSNRAQRRAQARSDRRGIPSQYDQTNGRGRSGMIDEHALQERSRRLQEHEDIEWKPSGGTIAQLDSSASRTTSNAIHMPQSTRQWLRLLSWVLIVISCASFLVIMWLSNVPMWLVITISSVFAIGVLSLFFVGGSPKENPNLDDYGTAV
ncbi:MAG: tripartite tricarboxylate transporter TctB family protein [Bifidobacterium sp.]|nr:tripartite tricarboxylate transporter TctB family protein [Bifidobacterium sp.]MCH4174395.1 tripartite tricarboxylate transporter TctB family protein [Bifidobacterium sp.]